MAAAAEVRCPACGQPLALGTSRVWVRKDGALAHVKCDPISNVPAARVTAVTPKPVPAHDGPVGTIHRAPKGGYSVTIEGVTVWAGPSATALSQWKRTQPGLKLEREAEVVEAERARRESRDRRALNRLTNVRRRKS